MIISDHLEIIINRVKIANDYTKIISNHFITVTNLETRAMHEVY